LELFILWIALAILTALAAASRGRSGVGWFFIGLLTGIFGLIAVLVMSPVNEPLTCGLYTTI